MSHTVALGDMFLHYREHANLFRHPSHIDCPPAANIQESSKWWWYLQGEGPQHHAAEDGVPVDALENVPLSVDLPGVDFVEELHHDEHVENDSVVLRRWWMQGGIAAAVNVEKLLTWETM